MMSLLSERMNPKSPPNVLVRDDVSQKLRNQVRHIVKNYLGFIPIFDVRTNLVNQICVKYEFEKGWGPRDSYSFSYLDTLLCKTQSVDFLDLVDIICQVLYNNKCLDPELLNAFKEVLNDVLRSNYMGYRVAEDKLIPITDPAMAENVIMPAFLILQTHGLNKARGELMAAFRHFGDGEFADALNSAYKALETIIEMCLNRQGVDFDAREKTTKKIEKLVQSGMLPSYLQDSTMSLSKMLESSGNVRNNVSGHGSATEKKIPESLVQYQLDMTASSILYLVESVFDRR